MKIKKSTILIFLSVIILFLVVPFFVNDSNKDNELINKAPKPNKEKDVLPDELNFDIGADDKDLENISEKNSVDISISEPEPVKKILLDPPFASQAPFGDWSDQRQQDGCEEASALMAVYWAKNKSLSKEEALKEIVSISDYLLETYGEYRDISSADTVEWIFKDYLNFFNVELKKNILLEDIIKELQKGNLVISPMNGQALRNPNFTPPGPPRHMLVIKGYDPEKNVFITNDPGTRNGESYVYNTDVLFEAIRDYPTGYHEAIQEIEKNIIVVSP